MTIFLRCQWTIFSARILPKCSHSADLLHRIISVLLLTKRAYPVQSDQGTAIKQQGSCLIYCTTLCQFPSSLSRHSRSGRSSIPIHRSFQGTANLHLTSVRSWELKILSRSCVRKGKPSRQAILSVSSIIVDLWIGRIVKAEKHESESYAWLSIMISLLYRINAEHDRKKQQEMGVINLIRCALTLPQSSDAQSVLALRLWLWDH